MSGKKLLLKYEELQEYSNYRGTSMDIGAYFITLQYILIGSIFLAIALIFLYAYYGREEEETPE
jgi:hypothetical protein